MHVPEELKKPLRSFGWDAVRTYLESLPVEAQPMAAVELFQAVIRDGYLIARWGNAARRDSFLAAFRAFAETIGVSDLLDEQTGDLESARHTEEAYREVIGTLQQVIESRLPAEGFAWAAIRWAEGEYRTLMRELRTATAKIPYLIDPPNATFHLESAGKNIDPERVNNLLVSTLSLTVKMLAFKNKWYAADGRTIVLPGLVKTTDEQMQLAGGNGLLASIWGELEHSDGRQRYFGGKVTKHEDQEIQYLDGRQRRTVIRFKLSDSFETALYIAGDRLRQMLFQFLVELNPDPIVQLKVSAELPVPPAPATYVSVEEAHAALALSHAFFKSVVEVTVEYGGLTILEWLRGYAAVQKLARQHRDGDLPESGIVLLEEVATANWLVEHGLPREKAMPFISQVCLGTERDDLFDAPLIRCADGKLALMVLGAASGNLTFITLSQLSSLRANLQWKGPTLERDVIELLTRQGIQADRIKRKFNGKEFECDCIALWDGYLFLFECKNYSLPGSNPQAEYWFIQDQLDAALQVESKATILRRHPELAAEALGRDVTAATIVPVVLNGTPFSLPTPENEVCFYDASALHRFFEEGEIGMARLGGNPGEGKTRVAGTTTRLWAGDRPTATDLLEQLHKPAQVIQALAMYHTVPKVMPLSDKLVLVTQIIERLPSTVDTLARSLGAEPGALHAELGASSAQADVSDDDTKASPGS